jgi:hypothetical protein
VRGRCGWSKWSGLRRRISLSVRPHRRRGGFHLDEHGRRQRGGDQSAQPPLAGSGAHRLEQVGQRSGKRVDIQLDVQIAQCPVDFVDVERSQGVGAGVDVAVEIRERIQRVGVGIGRQAARYYVTDELIETLADELVGARSSDEADDINIVSLAETRRRRRGDRR